MTPWLEQDSGKQTGKADDFPKTKDWVYSNRPFPSYLLPLCQNGCETIHMEMDFTYTSTFMQIKLIFIIIYKAKKL